MSTPKPEQASGGETIVVYIGGVETVFDKLEAKDPEKGIEPESRTPLPVCGSTKSYSDMIFMVKTSLKNIAGMHPNVKRMTLVSNGGAVACHIAASLVHAQLKYSSSARDDPATFDLRLHTPSEWDHGAFRYNTREKGVASRTNANHDLWGMCMEWNQMSLYDSAIYSISPSLLQLFELIKEKGVSDRVSVCESSSGAARDAAICAGVPPIQYAVFISPRGNRRNTETHTKSFLDALEAVVPAKNIFEIPFEECIAPGDRECARAMNIFSRFRRCVAEGNKLAKELQEIMNPNKQSSGASRSPTPENLAACINSLGWEGYADIRRLLSADPANRPHTALFSYFMRN